MGQRRWPCYRTWSSHRVCLFVGCHDISYDKQVTADFPGRLTAKPDHFPRAHASIGMKSLLPHLCVESSFHMLVNTSIAMTLATSAQSRIAVTLCTSVPSTTP